MKLAYAFRRSTFYPWVGSDYAGLPGKEARSKWLKQVKAIGFDGLELGVEDLGGLDATKNSVAELRAELDDHGMPCVVVRAGGGYANPRTASESRSRMRNGLEIASWLGAGTVNTGVSTEPRHPDALGTLTGQPLSQGSSRDASEADFANTANALREAGKISGDLGVDITIEVHQHSIADNSWSTLHLLDLIDSPHVFANPDLGNIFWTYDEPEESPEEAIVALAPRTKYWHCKNLYRVHLPEAQRSVFVRVPLPDGEIDYRFAITAMVDTQYDGYLAIEGARSGDQLYADRRSVDYVKSVLKDVEAI